MADPYGDFEYEDVKSLDFFEDPAESIANVLNTYYTPFLVAFGTIGNIISVYIFNTSLLQVYSTSQYLSALAISDTMFLWILMLPWMKSKNFTEVFDRSGFCQGFVFLFYISSFVSSWIILAFTIERFFAVIYPLRQTTICTVSRARYIIAGIVVAAITVNLPVLLITRPEMSDCNINLEYIDHAARFNIIDTTLSFTGPVSIILVMNTGIVIGVIRLQRKRHQLCREAEAARGHLHLAAQSVAAIARHRSQERITRMLLLVSSVSVILNTPAYVIRIVAYAYHMSTEEYVGKRAALQQIALMMFNTNSGINFFLYCLIGQNFRRALRQSFSCLFCWRTNRRRVALGLQPATASSGSSSNLSNATGRVVNYDPTVYNRGAPGDRHGGTSRSSHDNIYLYEVNDRQRSRIGARLARTHCNQIPVHHTIPAQEHNLAPDLLNHEHKSAPFGTSHEREDDIDIHDTLRVVNEILGKEFTFSSPMRSEASQCGQPGREEEWIEMVDIKPRVADKTERPEHRSCAPN